MHCISSLVPSLMFVVLNVVLLTGIVGCGDGGKDAAAKDVIKDKSDPFDGSRDVNVQHRLNLLFDLVKQDKPAEAAELITYRGDDDSRNWKSRCDYSKEGDKKRVDIIFKQLKYVLAAGEPEFVTFTEEKESEGTWLIWEINFGKGENSKKARLASLEIDGFSSLGDTDIRIPR